jgi:hypothetical protein
MGPSEKSPEKNSILTDSEREFLLKSEEKRDELKENTRNKKWSRLKKRVFAGLWDFGLLFSQIDSDRLKKWYDGPEPHPRDRENPSYVSLEGVAEHAANVVAFLYRFLPYPVFLRALEAGIYRAERHSEDRRMITVNVDPNAIERVYAPTEENADIYDEDEIITKIQNGEELTQLERMAWKNMVEYELPNKRGELDLYDAKRHDGPD